jgi:DNA-binding MarR family transcriptional regulator
MVEKTQAFDSAAPLSRTALIADLRRAAREASGLGNVFANAIAERLGVNPTDVECLGVIAASDSVTAGDLAAATGLTTGAITGVIDRLERAGLARRERDRDDRRKVYVRMTRNGGARAMALYASLGRGVDRLAARHTSEEIALLTRYFDDSRALMLREIAKLKRR